MPTNTRTHAFLAALVAAVLTPSLGFAQAPAPQAAQPSAPAAAAPAPAPAPAPAVSDEKSVALLADLRKAIGGDAKIAALKTVSFEGTYRRVQGEQDTTGDLELYFAAPDKFQRVEQFSFGPNPGPRIAQTVSGTEGWMGPLGPVPGGMAFRFGGPGGPGGGPGGAAGGPGGGNRGPGGPGGQRIDPGLIAKQTYWRTALAMFPGTDATSALSFTYVGKAESPDGEADVLDVKGDGNFKARLFVDAKTHLPVMLTYQERERNFRQVQRNQGETDEAFRARMRAEREAAGPPPPPKMIDISMFITEHKDVGGVKVPHHFTMQTGDKPTEEWELKKSKANPKFDDEQFKRKTSN